MSNTIKIRAKVENGVTTVKTLMDHPMETGSRKDKDSGEVIPAHYIQEVTADLNGEQVFSTYWGTGISKNPYLSFKIKGGAAGDTITIKWTDNKGETGMGEAKIK